MLWGLVAVREADTETILMPLAHNHTQRLPDHEMTALQAEGRSRGVQYIQFTHAFDHHADPRECKACAAAVTEQIKQAQEQYESQHGGPATPLTPGTQ